MPAVAASSRFAVAFAALVLTARLSEARPPGGPVVRAAHGPAATISGQLTNLRGGRGVCYLALFASAEGFPRQADQAVRTLREPVSGATVSFRFENLPPGAYALAVYHDENGNGRLDKNFLGLPTERYGFSNNARSMMFFPPSFSAARFVVAGPGATVMVKLR